MTLCACLILHGTEIMTYGETFPSWFLLNRSETYYCVHFGEKLVEVTITFLQTTKIFICVTVVLTEFSLKLLFSATIWIQLSWRCEENHNHFLTCEVPSCAVMLIILENE